MKVRILNQAKTRWSWIRPLAISLAILVAIAAVGGALVGLKAWQFQQMASQGPPPETPTAVQLAEAKPISFRQTTSAIGTLVAPQWVSLSNEIAGTVTRVNLHAGTKVKQGEVLLQLDTSIEEAQLLSAKAAAKAAQSRYQRTMEAFRSGALTPLERDEADSGLAQAEARVSELEALIQRKTLIAPFDAIVGLSDTHVGQYLPSGTRITMLQGTENFLFVDFTIPQEVAHEIDVGQAVSLQAGPTTLTANITALDSQTDRITRNRMVRAKIESAPSFLKPGDSVKVNVQYGPEVHAVGVPAEALRRTPFGSLVFVAKPDDAGQLRSQQRTVQVIQTLGNQVALFSGIQAGETVVTMGSFKLMDNGLLQVAGGEATAASGPQSPGQES